MIKEDNNIIKELFTLNKKRIGYATIYFNGTKEEIYHIFTCTYYFYPDIKELYEKGDIDGARRLILNKFRGEIYKDNNMGARLRSNKDIEKQLNKAGEMYEVYDTEEEIINEAYISEQADKVKMFLSKDEYDFIIRYYKIGGRELCEELKISHSACRKKASRIINKIRDSHILS